MKLFSSITQKTGLIGENLACLYLKNNGFKVIERNYTKKLGEIDIVAQKDKKLHFIEVKSVSCEIFSRGTLNIRPEENFTRTKLERFSRMVQIYLSSHYVSDETPWEIDLLTVFIDPKRKQGTVRLFANANID